jgi:hypothetical protein
MHDPRSTAPDDSGAARVPPAGDAAHPPLDAERARWIRWNMASIHRKADKWLRSDPGPGELKRATTLLWEIRDIAERARFGNIPTNDELLK